MPRHRPPVRCRTATGTETPSLTLAPASQLGLFLFGQQVFADLDSLGVGSASATFSLGPFPSGNKQ